MTSCQPRRSRVIPEPRCAPMNSSRLRNLVLPSMAPRSRRSDMPMSVVMVPLFTEMFVSATSWTAPQPGSTRGPNAQSLGSWPSRGTRRSIAFPGGRKRDAGGADHVHVRLHDAGFDERVVGAATDGDGDRCGASAEEDAVTVGASEFLDNKHLAGVRRSRLMRCSGSRSLRHGQTCPRNREPCDARHHEEPEAVKRVREANRPYARKCGSSLTPTGGMHPRCQMHGCGFRHRRGLGSPAPRRASSMAICMNRSCVVAITESRRCCGMVNLSVIQDAAHQRLVRDARAYAAHLRGGERLRRHQRDHVSRLSQSSQKSESP